MMKLLVWLTVYAGLATGLCAAEPIFGFLGSDDNGRSWLRVTDQFRSNRVNVLLVMDKRLWAATDRGLFASMDDGATWIRPASAELRQCRVLALVAAEGVMLAGTDRRGIWRSRDQGSTWSQVAKFRNVRSLAWNRGTFWAGCDEAMAWASDDSGTHWQKRNEGLPPSSQVLGLHATSAGRLYAALYNNGFYEFREGGWHRLAKDACPLVMFVDDDVLLSGQNPGGILRSVDGGASWRRVAEGVALDAPSWFFLEVGETIYYGTTGFSGLLVSADRGETWRSVSPKDLHHRAVVVMAAKAEKLFAITVENPTRSGSDSVFDLPQLE